MLDRTSERLCNRASSGNLYTQVGHSEYDVSHPLDVPSSNEGCSLSTTAEACTASPAWNWASLQEVWSVLCSGAPSSPRTLAEP